MHELLAIILDLTPLLLVAKPGEPSPRFPIAMDAVEVIVHSVEADTGLKIKIPL